MTYSVSKVISLINRMIAEKGTKDFPAEFYEGTNTYDFVKHCTRDSRLDRELVNTYHPYFQKDCLYNILVQWCDMRNETANDLLNENNRTTNTITLISLIENGKKLYFRCDELDTADALMLFHTDSLAETLSKSALFIPQTDYIDNMISSENVLEIEFNADRRSVAVMNYFSGGEVKEKRTSFPFDRIPAAYDHYINTRYEPISINGESVILPDGLEGEWRVVDGRQLLSDNPQYLVESVNYGLSPDVKYAIVDGNGQLIMDNVDSIDAAQGQTTESNPIRIKTSLAGELWRENKGSVFIGDYNPADVLDLCSSPDYTLKAYPSAIWAHLSMQNEQTDENEIEP